MSTDPKIYLAIDNCFAARRWTEPAEWAAIVRDLGVYYVEASADNECDPLYTTPGYLKDWIDQVRRCGDTTGVRVANFYSGHGTYATLGLCHPDTRIRDRILDDWMAAMSATAGALGAGMGFHTHAFNQATLNSPQRYAEAYDDLVHRLAKISGYAVEHGLRTVGVEQMYTPHLVPWTISGTIELLRLVYAQSGQPLYTTIDTGHHCAQRGFMLPTADSLRENLERHRSGDRPGRLWLGPQSASGIFNQARDTDTAGDEDAIAAILKECNRTPYLFAAEIDGDPYSWLETLGCYSPIIHLQQSYGDTSRHLPFTGEHNAKGRIQADSVLQALHKSYQSPPEPGMPPVCDEIYLTLEPFSATPDLPDDILDRQRESVAYWRRAVPDDGRRLSELVSR